MFARATFSFHPARPHTPSRFPAKSFLSPTYKHFPRNSFVSPTYAKTGGCTPRKMSARRHLFSLFSQTALSTIFLFNCLRTLSFSVAHLSPVPPAFSALFPQKRGYHSHLVISTQPVATCRRTTQSLFLYFLYLHPLHSPPIHNPVTAPSPILLPLLSQCSPVRGPTQTPCLPLSHRVRYTSTNANRSARCLHETRTHH